MKQSTSSVFFVVVEILCQCPLLRTKSSHFGLVWWRKSFFLPLVLCEIDTVGLSTTETTPTNTMKYFYCVLFEKSFVNVPSWVQDCMFLYYFVGGVSEAERLACRLAVFVDLGIFPRHLYNYKKVTKLLCTDNVNNNCNSAVINDMNQNVAVFSGTKMHSSS